MGGLLRRVACWIQYTSRADFFTVNFPGEPTVRDITYPRESRGTLPGRIHSVENGPNRYSVTVIDYANVQENELRGALDYAAWTFLQRDAKVTHYAYYYLLRRTS